jgi:hypothetical protein
MGARRKAAEEKSGRRGDNHQPRSTARDVLPSSPVINAVAYFYHLFTFKSVVVMYLQ